MRILHVSPGKLYGGVESFQLTMARYRDLCPGMEPEFATCYSGRLVEELRVTGVPTHILGEVRVSRPLTIFRARAALRALLRNRRFEAVVCHMPWTNAIFGPVARSERLPLVFWMHNASDGKHWTERWSRLTPPDLAICPSEFARLFFPNLFPNLEAAVLNYPVAPPDRDYRTERDVVRTDFSTPIDDTVVIQVSRLEPMKGHFLHLESLGLLKDLPAWTCWMVGGVQRVQEESYLENLKQRAHQLGIFGRIRFVGERRDVPRLLAAADIYCQPNISNEGLPVIFTEALYAGLPVVSTKLGGFWETVDESCGRLVEPGNPRAITKEIEYLISNPELRKELGNAARVRAREKFHPSYQLPKLAELLKKAIEQPASRADRLSA
ncbi:MAG: glycosyltransferase family 4 protein [Candidatus Binataceae bacterium]